MIDFIHTHQRERERDKKEKKSDTLIFSVMCYKYLSIITSN